MNVLKRVLQKILLATRKSFAFVRRKVLDIQYYPPNHVLYIECFDENSIIIDVGCGSGAEFSKYLIEKHNLQAFGIDPTIKHAQSLKGLEDTKKGKFRHLALAVTKKDGFITFHESRQNESGSILLDHINMQHDDIISYNVESVSLRELVQRTGRTRIHFLKLDLEGAEYELLNEISDDDLNPFKQIFIEFHDHCTNHTIQETMLLVRKICSRGFKVFTLDRHNYLFYK